MCMDWSRQYRRCLSVCLSVCVAVQNERDRISVRRSSYDDVTQTGALSVGTLHSAELLSRQVERSTLHSLSRCHVSDLCGTVMYRCVWDNKCDECVCFVCGDRWETMTEKMLCCFTTIATVDSCLVAWWLGRRTYDQQIASSTSGRSLPG